MLACRQHHEVRKWGFHTGLRPFGGPPQADGGVPQLPTKLKVPQGSGGLKGLKNIAKRSDNPT